MVMISTVKLKKANLVNQRCPLEAIEVVNWDPRLHFRWLGLTAEMIA